MTTGATTHPIFERYSLQELGRRTGYSVEYLADLLVGHRPISKLLKRKMSRILNEPESALFASDGGE